MGERRLSSLQGVGVWLLANLAKLLKYGLTHAQPNSGCDGVAVSTVGCGPAGPGSSPGHGPRLLLLQVIFADLMPHSLGLGG